MGGYGSGTWSRWFTKPKVESFISIDVVNFLKWGYLQGFRSWRRVTWSRNGEETGAISVQSGRDSVVLDYQTGVSSGDPQSWNYEVQIEWTPCNYGGKRPWFRCPKCFKRVRKLYGGQLFLCRSCRDCVYNSQSANFLCQAISKRERLEAKLYHHSNGLMYRPKGMHWKTFNRINAKLDAHEYGVDYRFELAISRLNNRRK